MSTLVDKVRRDGDLVEKCHCPSQCNIFVDAHTHVHAATAFTHGHDVCAKAVAASTRI
jgi:hypothetical protein